MVLDAELNGGTKIPQEKINEFVALMQKVQAVADVAGRKRVSLELEDKGIDKKTQEKHIKGEDNA